ncbi:D-alanine--D-alanine ligase B [Candidatus Kinetoplastibacterium sorsogonicusi]|uniref:D-alanine--D-alanine ligase n=2 Tax=Candidatus Kinetoplastidibacterium kentomonadis TaxID=1576550 RepID=A0A3S7JAE7_9PROT|nr:D-alanine--D-alanine ligase B [Candidatus Kinetoplastibacterium sorsogonicusi]
MNFGKVAILCGGYSAERDVSLMSGKAIYKALISKNIDACLFDIKYNNICELKSLGIKRAFISLHGRYGEDGIIQGALELIGIPYTGSGPLTSSLCMNKIITKYIWMQYNLPTPAFTIFNKNTKSDFYKKSFDFPVIVKPASEGSTLGILKAITINDLKHAIDQALLYDKEILIENFIYGRELTVGIINNGINDINILPIIEIITPNNNYDYEHKYFSNETQYFCPASLDKYIYDKIINFCELSYKIFKCEGSVRIDMILDDKNEIWLLEINTVPGMTEHSLLPLAAQASGLSYEDLCIIILSSASCKYNKIINKN